MNKKLIEMCGAGVMLLAFLVLPVFSVMGFSINGLDCFKLGEGAYAGIVLVFTLGYLAAAYLQKGEKIAAPLLLLPCILTFVKSDGASLGFGAIVYILLTICAILLAFNIVKLNK